MKYKFPEDIEVGDIILRDGERSFSNKPIPELLCRQNACRA